MFKQPPEINGILGLELEEALTIKDQLEAIKETFVPSDYEPALSLHGLVSRYNEANPGEEINGDTALYCLGQSEPVEPEAPIEPEEPTEPEGEGEEGEPEGEPEGEGGVED